MPALRDEDSDVWEKVVGETEEDQDFEEFAAVYQVSLLLQIGKDKNQ